MAETVTADPMSDPFTYAQEALFATFTGTPREQMVFSIILAAGAYTSSAFSFGATLVFGFLFSVTFLIGLARFAYRAVMD